MSYSKEIYERAWQALEERKARNHADCQKIRAQIHQTIPRVAEIEREIASTSSGLTRIILNSAGKAPELIVKLKESNLSLQREKKELLEEYGYPQDILSHKYSCAECRDSGYIGSKPCSCFVKLLQQEAAKELNLNTSNSDCRFDNFMLHYYSRTVPDENGVLPFNRMSDILTYCKEYASMFRLSSESLLMIGHTGLGKTHLSLSIARQLIQSGYGVVYTSAQRMFDRLEAERFSRSGYDRENSGNAQRLALECDLLILDDLGTEFSTQFTIAALYNIVNSRLMDGQPTIISTNLELPAIESRYSQRIVSRLICDYKVLRFVGEDIRYQRRVTSKRGMAGQGLT